MVQNLINSESIHSNSYHTIKCGICQSQLGKGSKIYKEGLNFGVVCEKCYRNNSPDDLELMANLFKVYGGYFGKLKDTEFSLYKALESLTSGASSHRPIIERNIKFLHQALLHGVGPHQFRQALKVILD